MPFRILREMTEGQGAHTQHAHTLLCEANRCRQQTRLKKPVSVPFYFDFYRKGCVNVCLELPVAVPTQPPADIHPRGAIDTQIKHTSVHHAHTQSH